MERGPEIVVYQVAWKEDAPAEEGEHPNALFRCRVFIDGEEIKPVSAIEVHASGGDFTTVKLVLSPGRIRFEAVPANEFYQPDLGAIAQ